MPPTANSPFLFTGAAKITAPSSANTITQLHIDRLMSAARFDIEKTGAKTTVVTCILPNGFEITESSSCVDPANYNNDIGVRICKERIMQRLWQLEGYLLQDRLYRDGAGDLAGRAERPAVAGLGFGAALAAVRAGRAIQRVGWHGADLAVRQQTPDAGSKMTLPYLYIEYPDGRRCPWLASQTDLLAEDWRVLPS